MFGSLNICILDAWHTKGRELNMAPESLLLTCASPSEFFRQMGCDTQVNLNVGLQLSPPGT